MDKLSDAELYTWEFLEENGAKVQLSSITQIAELAHVSTATVVRTLKKRGFEGYSDYKNTLKRGKNNERNGKIKGLSEEASVFINKNIDEVQRTINLLDADELVKIVSAINEAHSIMIVARGPSASVADDLTHRLQTLGKNAVSRYYDNMVLYAESLTANDLVIAVSSAGETQMIISAVKKAKKNGVKTVLLTCNYQSTLTTLSDFVLRSYKSKIEKSRLLGDASSRMPLELICRILLDLVAIYQEKGTIRE